jgi:hypothetical protein
MYRLSSSARTPVVESVTPGMKSSAAPALIAPTSMARRTAAVASRNFRCRC